MSPLENYLEERRHKIETALDYCSTFSNGCPQRLQNAVRYSLLAPGKRLRPMLTLIAAELCNGDFRLALPAAVAVEMIHCYSLIHDDLPAMDNDDLRRGRATCHKKFDEATAILAGDALLTRAFEVLNDPSLYKFFSESQDAFSSETTSKCSLELAKAAGSSGMVGGQQDDILFSNKKYEQSSEADISQFDLFDHDIAIDSAWDQDSATLDNESLFRLLCQIHQRKAAAMIIVSLKLGGIVAQANENQLELLKKLGQNFGLLFQITDDILDATGNEAIVGKKVHKDLNLGKLTFVSFFGLNKSRQFVLQLESICQNLLKSIAQKNLAYQSLQYLIHNTVIRNK